MQPALLMAAITALGNADGAAPGAGHDDPSAPEQADCQTATQTEGEPLSIDQAVEIGRARSFRIARSLRNQESADLREESARAAFRPRGDLNLNTSQAGRAYSYRDVNANVATSNSYADFYGGVTLYASMPIDVSGVLGRQVDQAELQQTIAGNDVLDAVLDVSLDIRLAYVEALRAQRAVDVDERLAARLEALTERASPSIQPFLQIELSNARLELNQTRTNADLALMTLRQSLRVAPDTPLFLTSQLDAPRLMMDRDRLLEIALAHRPDVREIDLRIEQARIGAIQTEDHRQPSLNVSAFYNAGLYGEYFYEPNDESNESGGVTLGLNMPLGQWDNGNLRRQRQRAETQVEQAMADAVEHREMVAQELRQQQISLDRAEERLLDLPDEADAFEELARAERGLLAASGNDASALIAQASNARSTWRAAAIAAIDARVDYYAAAYRLIRAMGLEPEAASFAPPSRSAGEAKALPAVMTAPEASDEIVVLRPVEQRDAPPAESTRESTQRSDIVQTGNTAARARRESRPGLFSRLVSFVFGNTRRTVVWD